MATLLDWLWTLYHWLLRLVDPTHPVSLALRAEQALERHQWGKAFDLSNSALKKRDDLSPAFFVRSVARLHLDDYKGALHDLNRFLAMTEEPPAVVYYWRGWIYAHSANWTMAMADFERVREFLPNDPQLHYWRAYVFWQREEWARMREALVHLEMLSPGNPLAWELRGHLLLHEGKFKEAEQAYSHAMETGWESPDLHYNRALSRRYLGHYAAAKQDIEAIFRMDPDNLWAHLELSNFALEAGEYQDALQHARAAIAIDEQLFEARLGEAATLMAMEENEAARGRLEAMREEFPDQPLVEQLYGDLLSSEAENEAAVEAYERVLTLEPDNHNVRLKLAGEWIALQRFEVAEEQIDQVLLGEPENVDALATRADLYRYSNRPAAMRTDLDRLLLLDPENVWALAFRAAHRHWSGDVEGALADYDAALAADNSQAWIWAFRGQFHLRHGRIAAARDDFQQAITLDPSDPWIRRQWASLLSRGGYRNRAAEVLDCLIDDYPDDGFARLSRAELYLLAGEWHQAQAQFEAIVQVEHELTWLAHAALAVWAEEEARQHHLALADEQQPEPTYWGMTPATVLAHGALVAWQRGDTLRAELLLLEARQQLEPGEILWRALRPLFALLAAHPLLALLDEPDPVVE